MGRRSHSRALDLWMNGAFVGTWSITPQGDTLLYAQEWIDSEQGRPLSLSLPFTPDGAPLTGKRVSSYFDNLLPDTKDIRERVARRYNIGSTDAFDLLTEIGRDCVGAIQLLPQGTVPAGPAGVKSTPLTEAEVAHLLRVTTAPATGKLGDTSDSDDDEDLRISIAGAQEKTALLYYHGKWRRPKGDTPTTHIFKLPMGVIGNLNLDMSHSVENEWLCSRILKEYGLPVADCEPLQFEDITVLSVKRFDRTWWRSPEGVRHLIRLPQEDMCQATGKPPSMKYQVDGGPGIDTILTLLATSMNREADQRTFFQAQVLFWMLRANDGHAKNFSIAHRPGGRYELTPLYDVLSFYPVIGDGPGKVSPKKVKMAMAVKGKSPHYHMEEIRRRHWVEVGLRHGVLTPNGQSAEFILDDLVAKTPQVIDAIRKRLPVNFPQQVANTILTGLQVAANKLGSQK